MGIALSGNDSLIINDRVFNDLADADWGVVEFPNEVAQVKTGKNGNSIFGKNESGRQANLTIRLLRGSSDDKFLNGLFSQQQGNFAGFPLLTGEFTKKIGDGSGAVKSDTYILSAGVFTKQPGAKGSVEGDTEQSVTIWTFRFAIAPRVIT